MTAVTVNHLLLGVEPLPTPDVPSEIRLVAPCDVPDGAIILGHVVAVPAGDAGAPEAAASPPAPVGPQRKLVAVRPAPGAEAGSPRAATAPPTATPPAARADQATAQLLVDRPARRVFRDGDELILTRREFELLEYLVSHPGRVFTRGQLLTAVWGDPDTLYGSPRTVDVHIARLRRKLGTHGDALQTLRGVGYRWSDR